MEREALLSEVHQYLFKILIHLLCLQREEKVETKQNSCTQLLPDRN